MTPVELSREFDAVCRQLHVEPREMRFGRTRHRAALLVTVARVTFILRVWNRGATGKQVADSLEFSVRNLRRYVAEFRSRGLLADRPPRGRSTPGPEGGDDERAE